MLIIIHNLSHVAEGIWLFNDVFKCEIYHLS